MVAERGGTGESRNTDVPQTPKIAEQQSVEQSGTVLRLHPIFERLSQALNEQQDEQQVAEQSDNLLPLHPIWERLYQVLSKPKEVRHIRQAGGGITADASPDTSATSTPPESPASHRPRRPKGRRAP